MNLLHHGEIVQLSKVPLSTPIKKFHDEIIQAKTESNTFLINIDIIQHLNNYLAQDGKMFCC